MRHRTPGEQALPSTILVTSIADSGHGTLRAAILKANNDMHDLGGRTHKDTIKFAHAVHGTISLQSALPELSGHFAIAGPGASVLTVHGNGSTGITGFRIFTVATGAVISISGLDITGGSSAQGGGGIENAGTLSLADVAIHGNSVVGIGSGPVAANSGGGIENTGTLSITNSSLYNNSAMGSTTGTGNAGYGGGIANTGTLSVANSMFNANSATNGGGIMNSGSLSLTNCLLSNDTASGGAQCSGGGIDNTGMLSIALTEFLGNLATGGQTVSAVRSTTRARCR